MLPRKLGFERLESRSMLAVTASMTAASGVLTINSDAAEDAVALEGAGPLGSLRVYANGAFLRHAEGVRSIRANLGSGNDRLDIAAVSIGGDVIVNAGSGSDVVDVDNTPGAGPAADSQVFIGGSLTVNMGNDAGDRVDFAGDASDYCIFIGRNVSLTGVADVKLDGQGGDWNLNESDIAMGGSLLISLSSYGDVNGDGLSIAMDDLNVGNTMTVNGSLAADRVLITDSVVTRRVSISLRGGDDLLDLDGGGPDTPNMFNDRFTYNGGPGTDSYNPFFLNVFAMPPVIVSVEITVGFRGR